MLPFLPPADAAARFDAFMKAHPAFVARVEVLANGKPLADTTLRVARPRRLRFDAKAPGLDFSVSSTERDYIEVDRVAKVYDQRPSTGGFQVYDSRISPAPSYLPPSLLATSAKGLMGEGKLAEAPTAGGDELHTTVQTPNGPIDLRLVVDPQGKPVRYARRGAGRDLVWRLAAFADAPADLAPFRIGRPTGYVPYALPDLPTPLAVGEPAPLKGWRQGGRTVDLGAAQPGRPRLIAVLGADSPPSRAARPFLLDLARSLPVFLVEPGGITDPSGTQMRRLSPPGTPMFYLVGADGKIARLWFGFDAAKGAAWEAEVREAAQGKAKA